MKRFKTFDAAIDEITSPRTEVHHEIIYYIEVPLTFDQWVALDNAMEEAFEKAGVDIGDSIGIAGPIPFPEEGRPYGANDPKFQ